MFDSSIVGRVSLALVLFSSVGSKGGNSGSGGSYPPLLPVATLMRKGKIDLVTKEGGEMGFVPTRLHPGSGDGPEMVLTGWIFATALP